MWLAEGLPVQLQSKLLPARVCDNVDVCSKREKDSINATCSEITINFCKECNVGAVLMVWQNHCVFQVSKVNCAFNNCVHHAFPYFQGFAGSPSSMLSRAPCTRTMK